MNCDDILEASWLLLKFANEEWGMFTPGVPELEMTPAQLRQYRQLKSRYRDRVRKTRQLAELQARLDLLYLYDDTPGFRKAIEAFEETTERTKSKGR